MQSSHKVHEGHQEPQAFPCELKSYFDTAEIASPDGRSI
jgi:hypothetical protein